MFIFQFISTGTVDVLSGIRLKLYLVNTDHGNQMICMLDRKSASQTVHQVKLDTECLSLRYFHILVHVLVVLELH